MQHIIAILFGLTDDKVAVYVVALQHALGIALLISGIAAHVVAVMGSPKAGDDVTKLHKFIQALIDAIAGNYGKAKNADRKP